MTTTAASSLLKAELLEGHGLDARAFGTHSGKATVLSWLSKAGVGKGTRRLLGGHATEKDQSLLEYSRDALAGPLRDVELFYKRIAAGAFLPDATRSGRWAGEKAEDSASSDTSSATSAQQEEEEEAADAAEGLLQKSGAEARPFPAEGLVGNRATHSVHRGGTCFGTTACGHVLTVDKTETFSEWPSAPWAPCRRARCFPGKVPDYLG